MAQSYQVYELVNLDRGEIIIGICAGAPDPGAMTVSARKDDWGPRDRVTFRVLEDFATLPEAAEFAVTYSDSTALEPQKVFLGPELAPAP